MKIPIIDPLGILKEPAENTLKSLGVDVELSDPIRDLVLDVIEGEQEEEEGESKTVYPKPPYDSGIAKSFADDVCSSRTGKQKWSAPCRDNVSRIVEMWLTNPDFTDEQFNEMLPNAASSIPHNVDYAARYREMLEHEESREAYLNFGKRAITFSCSRCQAIAEQVAARYAPDSPKKQLECMYYIKMFDENEIGDEGYETAKNWLEEHNLKDALYEAYLTELGVAE